MEEQDVVAGDMTPFTTRKFGKVTEFLRKANDITETPKVPSESSSDLFLESLADNSMQETTFQCFPSVNAEKDYERDMTKTVAAHLPTP